MSDDRAAAGSSGQVCPVAHTLKVLGASKWTGYVIRELLDGTKRFGEIRRGVGEANPKPLTDTLRVLEDMNMITRTVHAEVPPRVEYALTARGRSLTPVIDAMAAWGTADLRAAASAPPAGR